MTCEGKDCPLRRNCGLRAAYELPFEYEVIKEEYKDGKCKNYHPLQQQTLLDL